jgi:hypothetical protein
VFASLLFAAVGAWRRRPAPSPERTGLALLFLLVGALAVLGTKSVRAMEYAVPCAILLAGYAVHVLQVRHALPALLAVLLLCQGALDYRYYREGWLRPVRSGYPEYAAVLRQVPAQPGLKVFNCEWEAGAFILYARPDLRFVDLLEPAFLWHASPLRHQARKGLVEGAFDDPRAILRGAFDADYVWCGTRHPRLVEQMDARPQDFRSAPGSRGDPVRLFAVRPD